MIYIEFSVPRPFFVSRKHSDVIEFSNFVRESAHLKIVILIVFGVRIIQKSTILFQILEMLIIHIWAIISVARKFTHKSLNYQKIRKFYSSIDIKYAYVGNTTGIEGVYQ